MHPFSERLHRLAGCDSPVTPRAVANLEDWDRANLERSPLLHG